MYLSCYFCTGVSGRHFASCTFWSRHFACMKSYQPKFGSFAVIAEWPTDKWNLVTSCMEDHLFAHVYSYVFHPNGDIDTERDQ